MSNEIVKVIKEGIQTEKHECENYWVSSMNKEGSILGISSHLFWQRICSRREGGRNEEIVFCFRNPYGFHACNVFYRGC